METHQHLKRPKGAIWPAACLAVVAFGLPIAAQTELDRVLERLLAPPVLEVADGFTARVLIPPGELYDPLFMRDHEGQVWLNDDGGEEGEKGSQILAVDEHGNLSTVIPLGRMLPVIGFDIAPASFAPYEGQIFSLAQAVVSMPGVARNHIIQRIDPGSTEDGTLFCTLPMEGTVGEGIAGMGIEARFGPDAGPFSGRFYAVTILNSTVYQVTPDGECTPFVTFDVETWGQPMGLAFTPDGQHMLVSTGNQQRGTIARVRPDGTIDTPLVQSTEMMRPTGMAFAPASFGPYAGQLFVAMSSGGADLKLTHPPAANGRVYRVTPEGQVHEVVSGLHSPMAVHFTGDRLWVSDIKGDFIAGRRELPEGFVIEVRLQGPGAARWTVPRTAAGHPDLAGIWANDSATPLERPEGFEDKPELSAEELATLEQRAAELYSTSSDAAFFGEVFRAATSGADEFESICAGTGNHNQFWLPERQVEARTSLIVDPPDGKIPYTAAAREQMAALAQQYGSGAPAASWEQLPLITRCITNGVPNLLAGYNANYLIAQTADYVMILQELMHEARIIPLDGRPHLPAAIQQWIGDSRGRFEGDTLVVTTTNFTGKTRVQGASDALRLVERYTRVGPDTMHYEFTVEDPATFASSWTARITLQQIEGPIFEYSCHEGNRGLENILRGARVQEAADPASSK